MRLPKYVEPRKLAQKNGLFDGFLLSEDLPRIVEAVHSFDKIGARLEFDLDIERRLVMKADINGVVQLTCQRCLDPVDTRVDIETTFAMAWDEEKAQQLPNYLEPWIVGEDPADLHAIIEEEILLSLPVVAYHDHACIAQSAMSIGDKTNKKSVPEKRENPFEALKVLKNTLDKP